MMHVHGRYRISDYYKASKVMPPAIAQMTPQVYSCPSSCSLSIHDVFAPVC